MADATNHTMRARLRLERNGVNVHDRQFSSPDVDHSEETYQRITLPRSMSDVSKVDLEGVDTGRSLFLYTNRDVLVGVNTNTLLYPVLEGGSLMMTADVTSVFLRNTSQTNLATVELMVTDAT